MTLPPYAEKIISDYLREHRAKSLGCGGSRARGRRAISSWIRCLNIIENSGGVTAGELAAQAGLTTGAVTGVIDRLERAGYARRMPDSADCRRVKVEVTPEFYRRAEGIWGPMAADWQSTVAGRFSVGELERITEFLRATNEVAARHLDRIRET